MSIRVLLADDHKSMRRGLRSMLEKEQGMEVVDEADNGQTAVQMARELLPDVVIMDIGMRILNGIEATRQIVAELPAVKVLALSIHADRQIVLEMLKAGASGYLLKDCDFDELVHAINTVVEDCTYLSSEIEGLVLENYVRDSQATESSTSSELTAREREMQRKKK